MADASAGPVQPIAPEGGKVAEVVVIAPVEAEQIHAEVVTPEDNKVVAIAPEEALAPLDEVSAAQPLAATCESAVPVVEHSRPLTGGSTVNLSQHFEGRLGGAFSFMCTLTMEGIDSWTRVFDFSLQADEDSITAGAIDLTLNLHFTVFRGKKPISLRVDNFFELGKEFTMLCTVSDSGHMKVFKDGVMAGEREDGLAPLLMERPRMFVGGHFQFHNQTFRGSIKDVKVWNREVSWPESAAAAAPGETAEDLKRVPPPAPVEEPGKGGLDDAPDAPAQEPPEATGPALGTEAADAAAAGEGDEGASKRFDDETGAAELLAAGEGDEGAGKQPSRLEIPRPAPGSDASPGPAAGEGGEGAPAAGAA